MNVATALNLEHTEDIFEDEWSDLRDVEIITLNQYLNDQSAEEAWFITQNVDVIDDMVDKLRKEKYTHAKEFVDIKEDRFVIGINFDEINQKSIRYAINLLAMVDDLHGKRRVEFGKEIEIHAVGKTNKSHNSRPCSHT